jgi:hypothetical protein
VGLRSALRLTRAIESSYATAPPAIGSPWATGDLSVIAWNDLLDADAVPMTRAEALSVPPMARARDLICTTGAGLPLRALRGDEPLPDASQPAWCYRTDGPISPWHRMAYTLDDVLFTGWSLWVTERGSDGLPLVCDRVPRDLWDFGTDGRTIEVDGEPVDASTVILIPGPHEGILNRSARALRSAASLERAVANRTANPVPLISLEQTIDVDLDDADRAKLIAGYGNAVTGAAGGSTGIAFTSYGIRAVALGMSDTSGMLLASRNAAAVDVARLTGVPAALLDATNAGASLTYETTEGRNGEFVDYGLDAYTSPIAARLSQDDVVPRGTRIAFDVADLRSLTPAPTGAPTLD